MMAQQAPYKWIVVCVCVCDSRFVCKISSHECPENSVSPCDCLGAFWLTELRNYRFAYCFLSTVCVFLVALQASGS